MKYRVQDGCLCETEEMQKCIRDGLFSVWMNNCVSDFVERDKFREIDCALIPKMRRSAQNFLLNSTYDKVGFKDR